LGSAHSGFGFVYSNRNTSLACPRFLAMVEVFLEFHPSRCDIVLSAASLRDDGTKDGKRRGKGPILLSLRALCFSLRLCVKLGKKEFHAEAQREAESTRSGEQVPKQLPLSLRQRCLTRSILRTSQILPMLGFAMEREWKASYNKEVRTPQQGRRRQSCDDPRL
jgi:hypothetical protein